MLDIFRSAPPSIARVCEKSFQSSSSSSLPSPHQLPVPPQAFRLQAHYHCYHHPSYQSLPRPPGSRLFLEGPGLLCHRPPQVTKARHSPPQAATGRQTSLSKNPPDCRLFLVRPGLRATGCHKLPKPATGCHRPTNYIIGNK